jgi:hypothetical protein
MSQPEGQEPDQGPDPLGVARRWRLLDLAARLGGVGLPDIDGHRMVAAEAFGEPDVVDVAMGQQQRPDVVEGAPHCREFTAEVFPMTGQPGVDDGDAGRVLDEVAVDQARPPEAME